MQQESQQSNTHTGTGLKSLPPVMTAGSIPTALAPMQDVTTLPFMKVLTKYGVPDYFFTEYFRVYPNSRLDKHILKSITENPSGRPVVAQLLGNSLPDIRRIVKGLEAFPVAGVDLNVGCPAPKIYKNHAGGGLLRNLDLLDSILGTLRDSIKVGTFSVKIRIGFDSFEPFERTLELVRKHGADLLTIHARTVAESYRGEPHYEFIKQAAAELKCPVYANGNITSAAKANHVMDTTGCAGVMIGRSAIRNPWVFRQTREFSTGQEVFQPTLEDVYGYIRDLFDICCGHIQTERSAVNHLKKFANFVGQSIPASRDFLKPMRRCHTEEEFFEVCKHCLLDNGNASQPFPMEPISGVVARPNCEDGSVVHVTEQECKL